jgi:hypothetical protein
MPDTAELEMLLICSALWPAAAVASEVRTPIEIRHGIRQLHADRDRLDLENTQLRRELSAAQSRVYAAETRRKVAP